MQESKCKLIVYISVNICLNLSYIFSLYDIVNKMIHLFGIKNLMHIVSAKDVVRHFQYPNPV